MSTPSLLACKAASASPQDGLTRRFRVARSGSIGTAFALLLPALAGGVGIALDISAYYGAKSRAQGAADAAALATVRELALAGGADLRRLQASSERNALANLGALGGTSTITTSVDFTRSELKVDITVRPQGAFAALLKVDAAKVAVSATARLVGSQKICLIALDPTNNKAVSMVKTARLNASNCSVFTNSKHRHGLSVKDQAVLMASSTCSAGGVEGESMNFRPMAKIDCPAVPDPLAKRPVPAFAGCDHKDRLVDKGTAYLMPGVYCGGLKITGQATAKLAPGVYVIKDGKLIVDGNATLEGAHVGIYMTGNGSVVEFGPDTTISLTAPRDGGMAGMLLFEDRAAAPGQKHEIKSNNAHTLLGTIYLPKGYLHIDSQSPISQRAAYTIIVANALEMISGPELFLNANYGSTDIPVPAGVGPVSGSPRLEK
jgi:Flp pilus assembly protein TadG